MKRIVFLAVCLLFTSGLLAQNTLTVHADSAKYKISKYIYGNFAEHLGRCIYDGIWIGPDSDIPNVDGYRTDVLEALKALEIPVLRWPGGCFADTYHWMDGVGPRENRPKIKNVHWGGVIEDNSFGTNEFLNFCEMLGADPYISANVGSGSIAEMVNWIEYMTSDDDVPMANLRRANGREKPWDVKFFGIGNENWGCGGEMTPEHYADLLRNYSSYARKYGGNKFRRVACGANSDDFNWNRVLMENARRYADDFAVHYYTIAGKGWNDKGPATGFGEDLYFNGLKKAMYMDEIIKGNAKIMDEKDPGKRQGLMVDEWGIWTNVEPGTNPAFLFQQNSMRDALVASLTLDILNKHCDRVKMANIAQTVNVLQAVILTSGDKMVITPTYYVFDMYKGHKEAKLLPVTLTSEDYTYNGQSIPAVSQTVSLADDGTLYLTMSNVNPLKNLAVDVNVSGKEIKKVSGARVLTAPEFNSVNTFDNPELVKPHAFEGYKVVNPHTLRVDMPARSVVAMKLE
jgi:alpha-N-arabinofuranosidase